MNYSLYEFDATEGNIIEVTLSSQANVLLLDGANYRRFKAGGRYQYHGGLAKKTPVRLPVPSEGHWYVVIHLGGYAGHVRHSARLLN